MIAEDEGEEGKELMDIAKMVIKHNNGGRQETLISRTGRGEDSDVYAEPEEPQSQQQQTR